MKTLDKKEIIIVCSHLLRKLYGMYSTFFKNCTLEKFLKITDNIEYDKSRKAKTTPEEIAAEQYDAFADIIVYIMNGICKRGNLEIDDAFPGKDERSFFLRKIYSNVYTFTEQSMGKIKHQYSDFDFPSFEFLLKMILGEMAEMIQSIEENVGEVILASIVQCDFTYSSSSIFKDLVDVCVYLYDLSCTGRCNLMDILDLVHEANMRKKFPDGKFHRREDGKVIKPDGWTEPNILEEIKRQCEMEQK